MSGPVLEVGDQMRMSVEFLRQLVNEPDFATLLVEVKEVRLEPDGTKTLVMFNGRVVTS